MNIDVTEELILLAKLKNEHGEPQRPVIEGACWALARLTRRDVREVLADVDRVAARLASEFAHVPTSPLLAEAMPRPTLGGTPQFVPTAAPPGVERPAPGVFTRQVDAEDLRVPGLHVVPPPNQIDWSTGERSGLLAPTEPMPDPAPLGVYPGLGPIIQLAAPLVEANMDEPPAPPSTDSMEHMFLEAQASGSEFALPMDPETLAAVDAEIAAARARSRSAEGSPPSE